MKKIVTTLLCMALIMAEANAQAGISQYSGTVKYQKSEQPCTIYDVPYPVRQVEEGLAAKAKAIGASVRERNGFHEVKNWRSGNGDVYDLYYKVEKNGKNGSKLYAILTNPGEDVLARSSSHSALVTSAAGGAAVMASVGPMLGEHNLDVTQKALEEEIAKLEKKLKGLQDEQGRLEKKRTELDKDMEKNKNDQASLANELDAKKAGLGKFLENIRGKKNN